MGDLVEALRRGAIECTNENVAGWGNTMRDAADRIAELEQPQERLMVLALKHCPQDHHDWPEVVKLTAALQQQGESKFCTCGGPRNRAD